MKNLVAGMFIGAIVGGMVGTVASDEIWDMKKKLMRKGKRLIRKCDFM
jgi:hypothetical protein